jgi:hypothetical protein
VKDSDDFGHVKLARKMFMSDDLWLEKREYSRFEAWIDVIQLAAWRAGRFVTQKCVVDLNRGEFVASRRYLARRWQWTEKKVRVWLENAQNGSRVTAQRETQAGTVYLIVNYDYYQSNNRTRGPAKGTSLGQAGAQQGPKIEAGKAGRSKELTTLPDRSDSEARTGASDQLGLVVDPPSDVQVVLDHYVAVHPKRRPGEKERKTVERALRSYSPAELCEAIDGNARDEWHASRHKHELTYVLRDNGKIDDFRERAEASAAAGDTPLVDEFGCLTAHGELATRP